MSRHGSGARPMSTALFTPTEWGAAGAMLLLAIALPQPRLAGIVAAVAALLLVISAGLAELRAESGNVTRIIAEVLDRESGEDTRDV